MDIDVVLPGLLSNLLDQLVGDPDASRGSRLRPGGDNRTGDSSGLCVKVNGSDGGDVRHCECQTQLVAPGMGVESGLSAPVEVSCGPITQNPHQVGAEATPLGRGDGSELMARSDDGPCASATVVAGVGAAFTPPGCERLPVPSPGTH